jgi:hypothetical protein
VSGSLKQVAAPAKPVVITPAAMADGGLVTDPTILVGEAGREVVVPIDRRARGRETLHQAASMLGYSRYSTVGGGGLGQELRELRQAIAQLANRTGQGRGMNVSVVNHYPQAEATSTTVNRTLQLASNLGLD